jgi:hypothetical protein
MPNYYEISPAHDTLALKDGKGSASFTVRYVGSRNVEARASVVPMEGAEASWLSIEPAQQREMQPGQTHTFKVSVAVPAGTPPGRYGLRLDVVSVDNTDEEYDRGPLVTFTVEKSEEPKPPNAFPWWAVIVATVLLVIIIGAVVWWIARDDNVDPRPVPIPIPEPTEPVEPVPVDDDPDRRGRFEVSQTWSGDFDRGREVPRNAPRTEADFWFRARTATDRVINSMGSAKLAILGRRDSPSLRQVKSVLESRPVEEISVDALRPGFWIAVRTSEGNFAAFTLESRVGPSPSSMKLKYVLWEG